MSKSMTLEFPVKADHRDEFVKALVAVLPETREFDGCEGVMCWTAEGEPNTIVLHETWETKGHQEKYFAYRVESGMMDQIGPMLAGEPKVTWLDTHF